MFPNSTFNYTVKKYVEQVVKDKYTENVDETIDRLMHSIITKTDTDNFIALLGLLFQAGYTHAIEGVQKTLLEHGVKLKTIPQS